MLEKGRLIDNNSNMVGGEGGRPETKFDSIDLKNIPGGGTHFGKTEESHFLWTLLLLLLFA